MHFLNQETCVGIKRGGTLNVRAPTRSSSSFPPMPFRIRSKSTSKDLEMGDTLHISAVKLPEGCSPTIQDRDFTIATIATPAGFKEEAEEGETEGGEEEGKE